MDQKVTILTFNIAICMSLMVACLISLNHDDLRRRCYIRMLLCHAAYMLFELLSDGLMVIDLPIAGRITAMLSNLGFAYGLALFPEYVLLSSGTERKDAKSALAAVYLLCIVNVLIWTTLLWGGTVDLRVGSVPVGSGLFTALRFTSLLIGTLNYYIILRYTRSAGRRRRILFLMYNTIPMAASILRSISPKASEAALYQSSVTLVIIIIIAVRYNDQADHIRSQETIVEQGRTAIVHGRIEPHFLYNMLNTIYYLCGSDPARAQQAIGDFSDYMRDNMDSFRSNAPVPFSKELESIGRYLDLEKIRFGDELRIVYDIETMDIMVPFLSVRPLIENAVKYGVSKQKGGGTIRLQTRAYADCDEIAVIDDGAGFDPAQVPEDDGRSHTGIETARARIAAVCGGTLDIYSTPGEGTVAVITIPVR